MDVNELINRQNKIENRLISLLVQFSIIQVLTLGFSGCTNTLYSDRQLKRIATAETAETAQSENAKSSDNDGKTATPETSASKSESDLQEKVSRSMKIQAEPRTQLIPEEPISDQAISSESGAEVTSEVTSRTADKYTVNLVKIDEQTLTVGESTLTVNDIINNNSQAILVGKWNSLKPYYGTIEIQEKLFIKAVNDLSSQILQIDEANQYELVDSAGTYYLPKDNNIEPIKYIITDDSGFKAVYVIARDLETSEVGLYRLDYKANLTLAKDPSPFKGSLRLDELSTVRLYENAEKYQQFKVVYSVDSQIAIKNMAAGDVKPEDIRNISVSMNQFTRNVELDTPYMIRNPGGNSEQTIKVQVGLYNPDSGEIVTYSGTFDYDITSKENVINLYEIVNNNEVLESITK